MNDLARKITFLFGTSVILSWVSTTYSVLQITSGDHVNTSFHENISLQFVNDFACWFIFQIRSSLQHDHRRPQPILLDTGPFCSPSLQGDQNLLVFYPRWNPQIYIAPRTWDESFVPFKILYLFVETFEPFLLKGWIVCSGSVLHSRFSVVTQRSPLKDEFARFFKPCWVYFNLLKMSNVGEFPWSWFLADWTRV